MSKTIANTPKADHLMGSMRSMGYTFESAIADVVDNSISARAQEIKISFPSTALECFVTILDNGIGMSNKELINAMRYGSSSSESERDENDLGRFGLGLKAASLSQCRRLTVVSKRNGKVSAYQWDYQFILEKKDWLLIQLDSQEYQKLPNINDLLKLEHGTLVIWEDFDIIDKSSNGQVYATLNEYKEKIVKYIGLIFHRFISARGNNHITFYVNNHKVKALDPFLENNPKTTRKKEVDVAINDSNGIERHIKVQPYILPYQKDLTEADIEKLGGLEDMRTKQGYYIYRNNRLIIYGNWFGLPRTELTKNARIKVDIPNTLDDIWKIDIKKQNASIPKSIQHQLRRKVEEAMEISVRQQTHRGRRNNLKENIDYLWNRIEGRENRYYYEINRDSRLFNFIRSKVTDESFTYIEMLLDELEKSIPIQQMYLDQANNFIIEKESPDRDNEVFTEAIMMIDFAKAFKAPKEIIDTLFNSEPFCNHIDLKEKLYQHYSL